MLTLLSTAPFGRGNSCLQTLLVALWITCWVSAGAPAVHGLEAFVCFLTSAFNVELGAF